jgi:catalase
MLAQGGVSFGRGRVLRAQRNPENFFAEVEQASFSPDKVLLARLFLYGDTQRYLTA